MPTIYLIRHGQASFGEENYDQLSALGKKQAAHLGAVWQRRLIDFDAVVVGGMHRHHQTAQLCLAEMGVTLKSIGATINAGWNEYDHQDILARFRPELATAASVETFLAEQPNPKQAFEQAFNDAVNRWVEGQHEADYVESWRCFRTRVHGALRDTIERHKGAKQIAVFTSGGDDFSVESGIIRSARRKNYAAQLDSGKLWHHQIGGY